MLFGKPVLCRACAADCQKPTLLFHRNTGSVDDRPDAWQHGINHWPFARIALRVTVFRFAASNGVKHGEFQIYWGETVLGVLHTLHVDMMCRCIHMHTYVQMYTYVWMFIYVYLHTHSVEVWLN
jgi:hypothetical protein